jgi:hypothetical protein
MKSLGRLPFTIAAAFAVVACAAPGPTARPVPTTTLAATPTPTVAPMPSPTAAPTALAFPDLSEVALQAGGLYSSAPPFDISFTFVVPDDGWWSAHLHGEFFDVMRFDVEGSTSPTRWIAWAHPTTIIGATSEPAADLDPESAAALIATKPGITASATAPMSFAGLDGLRLDLHADLPNTHIFGGPAGNFGLEPGFDARLAFFDAGGELLLVLVLAPPAELETAWDEAQPILDSVVLE